jgi:hypothetical protein
MPGGDCPPLLYPPGCASVVGAADHRSMLLYSYIGQGIATRGARAHRYKKYTENKGSERSRIFTKNLMFYYFIQLIFQLGKIHFEKTSLTIENVTT